MNWYIYILRCADNSLYTGITTDLNRRQREHNGEVGYGAKYTLAKRPVRVVYSEIVRSRSEALMREAAIKKLSHTQKQKLYAV